MAVNYQREFLTLAHNKDGKPPVVYKVALHHWGNKNNANKLFCIHGLTRNARDFDFVAEPLTDKYHVIGVDVVGRGESDWADDKLCYNYDTYFDDMAQIIEQLKFEKINILGTSMGGLIGMGMSARYPGLIDKILLNDIGTIVPKEALVRIIKYIPMTPEFRSFAEAKDFFKIILMNFGIKEEDHWDHIVTHSIKMNAKGTFTFVYDPGIAVAFQALAADKVEDVNIREEWKKVNFSQMMIIHAEKSDVLLKDDVEFMVKSKPNISSITFNGIGHAPALVNEYEIKSVCDFFL